MVPSLSNFYRPHPLGKDRCTSGWGRRPVEKGGRASAGPFSGRAREREKAPEAEPQRMRSQAEPGNEIDEMRTVLVPRRSLGTGRREARPPVVSRRLVMKGGRASGGPPFPGRARERETRQRRQSLRGPVPKQSPGTRNETKEAEPQGARSQAEPGNEKN